MPAPVQDSRRVRFAPFEFDPRAGELRKHGLVIRLQEQPFQILSMLVAHPGELVGREEIRHKLWPNDTIVEFDHSINAAIKRLRDALLDTADEPRYVETVARRGYRFIAPVEVVAAVSAPGVAPEILSQPSGVVEPARSAPEAASLDARSPKMIAESSGDLVGQTVSHYRVHDRIGSGAMGVIYKAEDTRLDRMVALKFLSAELAQDRQALARFQREARAASALNHPNICTVHDIDEHAGQPFIAMELLEGETLKERLAVSADLVPGKGLPREPTLNTGKGVPLQFDTLLNLAIQIAAGLEAAHGKGIIHRDIKPTNIFLTTHGQAKILDFGIAKLTRSAGVSPVALSEQEQGEHATAGPTRAIDATLTQLGSSIGTAAYMSPEQARGEDIDARTDIFSFGAVLYEMATGRPAFPGNTPAVVFDAILNCAPVPPTQLNPDVPAELERVIGRALEKDRNERYPNPSTLLSHLKSVKRDIGPGGVGGTSAVGSNPRTPSSRKTFDSLAVLPFENVGSDPDAEYFSDGITESIIHSVSEFPNLHVMGRSTVFRYKGQATDPLAVGRQLNVRAVLTGRVRQRGDSLIIGTELMDTADGSSLWGKNYQRRMQDMFAVQEEIAREICDNLRLKLAKRDEKRLAKRPTENREAFHLYLKGRFFWNKRTEEGIRKGIEYYREAVEADPTYALAYAGLAESYMPLGYWGYLPPGEAFPKVKAWAQKALEIDDQLAEAHVPLGAALIEYERDQESGEKELQRALELNPNYPRAHQVYGEFLTWLGEFDAAADEIRQALELDPLSAVLHAVDAQGSYYARRFEEAIQKCRKSIEIEPAFAYAHYVLGLASEQLGRFEDAVEHLQKPLEMARASPMIHAELGRAYALWGKEAEARQILRGLERTCEERYVPAYSFAQIYAGLDDSERALLWLERANEERSARMVFIRVDPAFDALRSDPKFQDLLRRARLPVREKSCEL